MTEPLTATPSAPHPGAAVGPDGGATPPPPAMHWALLLLLSTLTLGLFAIGWEIVQANWARRVDAASRAPLCMWLNAGFTAVYLVAAGISYATSGNVPEGSYTGLDAFGDLMLAISTVCMYCGLYSIRRTMLDRYGGAGPAGLRMSAALTFILTLFYVQYHMGRIARRARSGARPAL